MRAVIGQFFGSLPRLFRLTYDPRASCLGHKSTGKNSVTYRTDLESVSKRHEGWKTRGLLPYIGYVGMCRCEGYGFQGVFWDREYKSERLGLE